MQSIICLWGSILLLVCISSFNCTSPPCVGNIHPYLQLDPNQRPCKRHCECNNVLFSGRCVYVTEYSVHMCRSVHRAQCSLVGQQRSCILSHLQGECQKGTQTCAPPALQGRTLWGDCRPQRPQPEICDGKDNDCDGQIDEGCACKARESRICGSTKGECKQGIQRCSSKGTWEACQPKQGPVVEICDGKDNDCDGQTDEGCECIPKTVEDCYTGPSGTAGQGICQKGERTCQPNGRWGSCRGEVKPLPSEICDGRDNNCNGQIDEGFQTSTDLCILPSRKGICAEGKWLCIQGRLSCQALHTPLPSELCDGKDNDCNGQIDEGCPSCIPQRLTYTLTGPTRPITHVAFSPNGMRLAASSQDGSIRIWDLVHPERSPQLLSVSTAVHTLAFASTTQHTLLLAAQGTQIHSWSLNTDPPKQYKVWKAHTQTIRSLAVHPQSSVAQCISGASNGELKVWDIRNGTQLKTLIAPTQKKASTLLFDWSGRYLYVHDQTTHLHVWDLLSGQLYTRWSFPAQITDMTHSFKNTQSGAKLGLAFSDGRIATAPSQTMKLSASVRHSSKPLQIVFSFDNKMLAASYADGHIRLWSTTEPLRLLATLPGSTAPAQAIAISPNRKRNTLAVVHRSKSIRLWECTPK